MFCTPAKTVIAAKQHRCTWCGQSIQKGESHEVWKSVDGSWFTNRMHPECNKALNAEMDYYGDDEYIAFSNERPTKE